MTDKPDGKRLFDKTAAVDAYLARKGVVSRLDEAAWQALIEKIHGLYGTRLYHWSRRITQAEDLMRRGHRIFPNAIKRPYRHLHYIAIVIRDSPEWDELKRWLDERQIEWREQRDPENDPYFDLRIYGFPPD
jgi:hypothetical protein